MNDNEYEPTDEQKKEWIVTALEQSSFNRIGDMDIYTHDADGLRTVVDLTAGISIYFKDGQDRIDEDRNGILAAVGEMIADAMTGQLPTRTDSDEVITKHTDEVPKTTELVEPTQSTCEVKTHASTELVKPSTKPATTSEYVASAINGVVRPAVSAQEALAVWREFQELQKAILEPSDFQIIQGKDYKKKSAWRKFAAFFNLNDEIVEEKQTLHTDGQGWTWKIKVVCTAPNGRFTEGVGICSTGERKFSHIEHDTYSTAHTRAKNRAISDMIAAGEVSAEEVSTK